MTNEDLLFNLARDEDFFSNEDGLAPNEGDCYLLLW
uniref:Uncharacterized protein n=1 Tax=Nelumbo nucifera TaxID=4432 RepID=A0A822XYX0_NELNU|nr:TPA_asm: hypothetical protein HUJ06_025649 [Nelumbo nucifera]